VLNLPEAFQKRMQEQLGSDYETFCSALLDNVPSSIRLNSSKLKTCPFEDTTAIPYHPRAYSLVTRPSYVADPLFLKVVY